MIEIIGQKGKFTVDETGRRVGRGSQAYWGVKGIDLAEYTMWLKSIGIDGVSAEIAIDEVTVILNNGVRLPFSPRRREIIATLEAGF